jgi:hypothetical protein
MVKNDAAPIGVFISPAVAIPEWIVGNDGCMAQGLDACGRRVEGVRVRQVEDEQALGVWRATGGPTPLKGELEMVPGAGVAKHDPIEPLVIAELTHQLEAQTAAVEMDDLIEMIGRASDPKVGKHERLP